MLPKSESSIAAVVFKGARKPKDGTLLAALAAEVLQVINYVPNADVAIDKVGCNKGGADAVVVDDEGLNCSNRFLGSICTEAYFCNDRTLSKIIPLEDSSVEAFSSFAMMKDGTNDGVLSGADTDGAGSGSGCRVVLPPLSVTVLEAANDDDFSPGFKLLHA
uniref:Uncharacterized protein n=1 Tax=Romanomermis culicivorax TaxID=13658 RepID=A0A915JCT9_ROMCU